MRCDILAFLCLFLAPFLTIAQADRRKTMLPWKFTIAGSTDSITVDEILSAGKLECSHKAFEIIVFTLAAGGDCLKDGLYAGANCPSLPFTAWPQATDQSPAARQTPVHGQDPDTKPVRSSRRGHKTAACARNHSQNRSPGTSSKQYFRSFAALEIFLHS